MSKEKKLNKGLTAIFGDDIDDVLSEINTSDNSKNNSSEILIKDIRVNPYQPRRIFDDSALKELAESIKINGVFQPILVRKALQGYELIAGERRLRASKLNKLEKIPAIILEMDDTKMMEISLLENIQRQDLSPIEEANAYNQLIIKLKYTQDQLAQRVSKDRTYITNLLRLLKLPKEVQDLVSKGKLSYTQARALINIEDEDKLVSLANRAVKESLTVREIERLSKEIKKPIKPEKEKDKYLENVRRTLEKKLETKVDVSSKNIVIHFNNNSDLNRILETLNCLEED